MSMGPTQPPDFCCIPVGVVAGTENGGGSHAYYSSLVLLQEMDALPHKKQHLSEKEIKQFFEEEFPEQKIRTVVLRQATVLCRSTLSPFPPVPPVASPIIHLN